LYFGTHLKDPRFWSYDVHIHRTPIYDG
jgi:hypothetical protein